MKDAEPEDDDDIASVMAACDEALAAGDTSVMDGHALPRDQARLMKDLECIRMLRNVWPGKAANGEKNAHFPQTPPERLGRFRIERELGRGGFGIVYLAFDPHLARTVALKVPRTDVLSTP